MKQIISTFVLCVLALALTPEKTFAWPKAHRIPDINGDCRIVGTVLGDSLVFGQGDNRRGGGYVKRTSRRLRQLTLHNEGVKALEAAQLLEQLKMELRGSGTSELATRIEESDFVILDIGRNDRWRYIDAESSGQSDRTGSIETAAIIKEIRQLVIERVQRRTGIRPLVITSVMMVPNRGAQASFVRMVNSEIRQSHSRTTPANLRFDGVREFSNDNIHPSPAGHKTLSRIFRRYLKRKLPRYLKRLHTDSDKDFLPDTVETLRGTLPLVSDTDADGLIDGEEVCLTGTNPLIPG